MHPHAVEYTLTTLGLLLFSPHAGVLPDSILLGCCGLPLVALVLAVARKLTVQMATQGDDNAVWLWQ